MLRNDSHDPPLQSSYILDPDIHADGSIVMLWAFTEKLELLSTKNQDRVEMWPTHTKNSSEETTVNNETHLWIRPGASQTEIRGSER